MIDETLATSAEMKYRLGYSMVNQKTGSPSILCRRRSRGMELMNQGIAEAKEFMSQAGRERKKLKIQKKYYRLETLTSIQGVPWIIKVKKK